LHDLPNEPFSKIKMNLAPEILESLPMLRSCNNDFLPNSILSKHRTVSIALVAGLILFHKILML
jgi:hypothetical protein